MRRTTEGGNAIAYTRTSLLAITTRTGSAAKKLLATGELSSGVSYQVRHATLTGGFANFFRIVVMAASGRAPFAGRRRSETCLPLGEAEERALL